jgi:hypothetical protein
MINKQGGVKPRPGLIMCCVDRLFPYHVTSACVGTDLPPLTFTWLIAYLKGLSHEIFIVIFWLEWIHIGLKGNRFWFFNFKDVSSILDSNFKF